jgi:hypothetical protein
MARFGIPFLVSVLAALAACESFTSAPLDGSVDDQAITAGDASASFDGRALDAGVLDPCLSKPPKFVGFAAWKQPYSKAPGLQLVITNNPTTGESLLAVIGVQSKSDGASVITIDAVSLSPNYIAQFDFRASALPPNEFKLVELYKAGGGYTTIQTRNKDWVHLVNNTRLQGIGIADQKIHTIELRVAPETRGGIAKTTMTVRLDDVRLKPQDIEEGMTLQIGAHYASQMDAPSSPSQVDISNVKIWHCL